jgi:hypothetical protein
MMNSPHPPRYHLTSPSPHIGPPSCLKMWGAGSDSAILLSVEEHWPDDAGAIRDGFTFSARAARLGQAAHRGEALVWRMAASQC